MYVYIYMLPPPMYLPFLPNLTQKHLYNYIIITKTLACRNTRLQCRHQAICRSTWCIQHHHHTGTSAAHATWHLGVCQGKYAPGASNIVRPASGLGFSPSVSTHAMSSWGATTGIFLGWQAKCQIQPLKCHPKKIVAAKALHHLIAFCVPKRTRNPVDGNLG